MVKNGERSLGQLDRRFLYDDGDVYDMDVTDRNMERGDDQYRYGDERRCIRNG